MLQVSHLTKRYGHVTALADVSFSIRPGEVLGLIGPNGSGKTTLFECLAGVLPADEGAVLCDGQPLSPRDRFRAFFYMPDAIAPWPHQTVRWALAFAAGFFGSQARKSDSQVRLPSQTPKSDLVGYSGGRANFAVYLTMVGAITALAYPLSCNVTLHAPPLLRYLLLAAVIPVGLTSWVFATDRSPLWRGALAAIVVVWSAANLTDNVRLIRTTVANPPVSEHHVLADYLIAHRIRYARAIYWDAYMLDFLSRERVIVASTDLIRIPEYQEEVEAHAADAVVLQRLPCSGDARVASWCVQAPPR